MSKRRWKATLGQGTQKRARASMDTEIESLTFVRTSTRITLKAIFFCLVASRFPDKVI